MADGKVIVDTDLNASGFKEGLGKLGSIASTGLKATTVAISAVGSGLLALGGYAVKVGSEFEAAMSNVEAISGASSQSVMTASGKMVDGLTAITEKAKEMGSTTKFSATESAEALSYMAMAGWDSQQMYDGLSGIMSLAAASGEDLATTADIVTDALTAFGMSAGESGHFADILAKASSASNTNVGMLGESFKYVAPLCGTLGFSAEDAAIALGLMANAGIKGSQAGTALRGALSALASPSKQQAEAMAELNISLVDGEGKMKSLRGVMGDLRTKFADLDKAEQAQMAATIFGTEAMSGMLSIINASDEDFEKLTNSIDNCSGTAEEMAAIMQDNLQGRITELQSAVEGLGIQLYEKMEVPLKSLAEKGIEYIGQLSSAFESGGFNGVIKELGSIFADAVSEMAAEAPEMLSAGASMIEAFIIGLQGNMPQVAQSAVTIATTLVEGICQILPQALQFGADFIIQLASGFASAMPELSANVGNCITSIVSTFADGVPQFIESGAQIIINLITGITESLPSLFDSASQAITSFMTGLSENAPMILDAGIAMLQELGNGIAQTLPELIPLAIQTILDFGSYIVANIGTIVDIGIQIIMSLAQGIVNSIPLIIQQAPKIINDFWNAFDQNAIKLISAGIQCIIKLGKGIIESIPLIIQNAGEIAMAILNTIMHLNLISAGKTLIKNLGTGIKAMISEAGACAKSVADNILNIIKTTDWLGLGRTIITFLKNGILNMLSAVASAGGNVAKAGFNAIKSIDWLGLGRTVITFVINGLKAMIGNIGSTLKSIATAGMNAFKGCSWSSVGQNVISGIVSGITAAAGRLVSAAVNAAKNALNSVKKWLGINSPSRRAKQEVGQWILPGIGEGVEETQPVLDKTMEDAASGMIETFDKKRDIDVSGFVERMRNRVALEVAEINSNIEVKSNSGSGIVQAYDSEKMDYKKLGDAFVDALARAGIHVDLDSRELGRLIAELA